MTRIALIAALTASVLLIAGAILGVANVSAADAAHQTAKAVTLAQG